MTEKRYPADEGFYMPAEWASHSRCWMSWPARHDLWGKHYDAACDAYAEVAQKIAAFEPVTMIVRPDLLTEASLRLGRDVPCLPLDHDDSWFRDNGPTFVVNRTGEIAAVNWQFNGYGGRYEPFDRDAGTAEALIEHLSMKRFEAPFILEGGAIHVDGEGTLLTTEQCLLSKGRNPDMTKADYEEAFKLYLGVEKVIWLGEGLEDDDTDGHVDVLAAFVRPGVVMALDSDDPQDANNRPIKDNLKRLESARDAKGREFEIIKIGQPKAVRDEEGLRLGLSYLNFYLANGAVIMPTFDDSKDSSAFDLFKKCFPDRTIVEVPSTEIFYGGGGIHCITQQQPEGGSGESEGAA